MNNTTIVQESFVGLPGTTASGVASAAQLVEVTASPTVGVGMTAVPCRLVVLMPQAYGGLGVASPVTPLAAEEYPVLAEIWDNDEDDIFETV